MSLFDKFKPLTEARNALAVGGPPAIATPIQSVRSATRGYIGDQEVLLAGTNNYLGLTFSEPVLDAAEAALRSLGAGTTGSRMANGSYDPHRALENELAEAFGWPAAIVFSTGYQANLGTLSALAGRGEYLVLDSDSHASIYDAARLSQAETIRFRHNDPENLDRRLTRLGDKAKNALIVVEGLYSMLGDQPPLEAFVEVKERHGSWLLVDEAHSFGVFGDRGLGLTEACGLLDRVDFIVGTFSKSLAGLGGFCVSPHPELDAMRLASRPYIFTASPSPATIAGTRAALGQLLEGQALRQQLHRNFHRFYEAVEAMGYKLGSSTPGPVAAILLPDRATALGHWHGLLDSGVYANLMIPPATPSGLNLLRLSLSAAHSDDDVDVMISALRKLASVDSYNQIA
jgi:8-amino-7-oxononanoate synthase